MMPFGEVLVVSSLDLYVLIVTVWFILWRVDLVFLDFGVYQMLLMYSISYLTIIILFKTTSIIIFIKQG